VENSLKSHWITILSWFQSAKVFYSDYGYVRFPSHLLQTLHRKLPFSQASSHELNTLRAGDVDLRF